jgi:multicomponent Na+:H+ antiporter subunit F
MSLALGGVPDLVIDAGLAALALALLLSVVRLVRGPSLMDRVVALELMAGLVVGVIAVYAIGTDDPALLDVAITLALVAFLGAVALARYAERSVRA